MLPHPVRDDIRGVDYAPIHHIWHLAQLIPDD
ncbi:Uncharacterised protein [Vibrio cholerae]|nr:Uncharacterised protein [Vibrio cholerae]CSI57060.1 Uncharacterised protein [Vibrio cholerae]